VDEEQKNCPADEELKELLLYIEHKVFNIRNEYNSATTLISRYLERKNKLADVGRKQYLRTFKLVDEVMQHKLHEPIVEQLFYKNDSVLLWGTSGVGKTTLVAYIVACALANKPLFGRFAWFANEDILYIQTE
jgi:DNA replication protein DnaC